MKHISIFLLVLFTAVTSIAQTGDQFLGSPKITVRVKGKLEVDSGMTIRSLKTTGTRSNTTFLRGDSTWATPAGGGGGGVPTTRTITINGNTQDLSADRSFNVSTPKGTLNVEDFGAVALDPAHPDRSINNRVALQTALDSCVRMGGCNFFMPGMYAYDSTLSIPLTLYTETNYPVIKFVGGRRSSFEVQGLSSAPPTFAGSGLYCRMVDTANLYPFALTYAPSPYGGLFEKFNYTEVDLGDLYLLVKTKDTNGHNFRNNVGGINLAYTSHVWGNYVRIGTSSPGPDGATPTSSIGFIGPAQANHGVSDYNTFQVTGFDTCIVLSEHTNIKHLIIGIANVGLKVEGTTYPISIQHLTTENNKIDIELNGTPIQIGVWEAEAYTGSPHKFYDYQASVHTTSVNVSRINIGIFWPLQTGAIPIQPVIVEDVAGTADLSAATGLYGINQTGMNHWDNFTRPTFDKLMKNFIWGYNVSTNQLEYWNNTYGWQPMANPANLPPNSVTQTFNRLSPWIGYPSSTGLIGDVGGVTKLILDGNSGTKIAYQDPSFTPGDSIIVDVQGVDIVAGTVKVYIGNVNAPEFNATLANGTNSYFLNTSTYTGGGVQVATLSGNNVARIGSITVTKVGRDKVKYIQDIPINPSTPVGGGYIFSRGGALYYKGSSGTVTLLANP